MSAHPAQPHSDPITCECGFRIWDSEVVRSRVLRITPAGWFEAKCKCKRWVSLPVKMVSKK